MYNAFCILFLILFAIAIVDYALYCGWNPSYYRKGFLLRRRFIQTQRFSLENIEHRIPELPMLFNRFDRDTIAYREKIMFGIFSKTPMIHGTIVMEPEAKRIRVDMLANWFTIFFPPIFIGMALVLMPWALRILFTIFAVFATMIMFGFSSSSYNSLCLALENMAGANHSGEEIES